jgi:hypothetical protein
MPPLFFGLHIRSQLIHGTFLLPSAEPHQNPEAMEVKELHILSESRKHPIGYVETDCKTDLISVSFPSIDKP